MRNNKKRAEIQGRILQFRPFVVHNDVDLEQRTLPDDGQLGDNPLGWKKRFP